MNRRKQRLFALAFAGIVASTTAVAAAQEHGHAAAQEHDAHGAAPGQSGEARETPHEAAEHEAGGHGEHALADINWTDIFDKHRPAIVALVINFGLLVGLYYSLGKKPVSAALKQRRVTIAKDIEDARKRLEEAQGRAEKYQADLKNADVDAATAKAALVTAGKGEVEKMMTEAQERAARMKRDAERLVEQEQKQLQGDLLKETVERAVIEAGKILEHGVSQEDHLRLAQDLLAELAKRPGATVGGAS